MRTALLATLVSCIGSGAIAQARESKADWGRRPQPGAVSAVPPLASALAVSGEATLDCRITSGGRIEDCVVTAETPKYFGFGSQAILLSPFLPIEPAVRDRVPVDSRVLIPIRVVVDEQMPRGWGQMLPTADSLAHASAIASLLGVRAEEAAPLAVTFSGVELKQLRTLLEQSSSTVHGAVAASLRVRGVELASLIRSAVCAEQPCSASPRRSNINDPTDNHLAELVVTTDRQNRRSLKP